ncbi:MAG: hypothetical protein A3F09_04020 [Chlamydiae bacterium RIFCSPHIGHO2_12_FULL_49_11]|nr:MAG: hypothetical protein A3F09_04020 [Chlamydiae bacterium RIFCSPHIGHO2_12_FULL_49_11]
MIRHFGAETFGQCTNYPFIDIYHHYNTCINSDSRLLKAASAAKIVGLSFIHAIGCGIKGCSLGVWSLFSQNRVAGYHSGYYLRYSAHLALATLQGIALFFLGLVFAYPGFEIAVDRWAAGRMPQYQTAALRMKACYRNKEQNLDLADLNIAELPPKVLRKLSHITSLNLSGNVRLEIPSLSPLRKLTAIHLSRMQLDYSFASSYLRDLPSSLTILSLDHNPLYELPYALLDLNNLRQLYLSDCQLKELPWCVGEKFENLRILDVRENPGIFLPRSLEYHPEIRVLSSLQK